MNKFKQLVESPEQMSLYSEWVSQPMTQLVLDAMRDFVLMDISTDTTYRLPADTEIGVRTECLALKERYSAGFTQCLHMLAGLDKISQTVTKLPEEDYKTAEG
jgi:hypothetical protein